MLRGEFHTAGGSVVHAVFRLNGTVVLDKPDGDAVCVLAGFRRIGNRDGDFAVTKRAGLDSVYKDIHVHDKRGFSLRAKSLPLTVGKLFIIDGCNRKFYIALARNRGQRFLV
ncbi:hypothetical protein SDC9_117294 [bioreactor metagenome]|uniref:Uncharacterized protein n=1 Tax=bioreactor metagenome TaxID=1076179 RepID=A0A645BY92_9ZZZZ